MTRAQSQKKRRAAATANGKCSECASRPLVAGKKRCAPCLDRLRARYTKVNDERREHSLQTQRLGQRKFIRAAFARQTGVDDPVTEADWSELDGIL